MTGADATGAEAAIIGMIAADPLGAGVIVDFDGSLAPIVERPESARPLPTAVVALGYLVPRLGRVAVVSGRPVTFLAEHLGGCGAELVGGYGAERIVDGARVLDPRFARWSDAMAEAAQACSARFPALTEVKGGVGVTLHWRPEPAREHEIREVAAVVAERLALVVHATRSAVELRPPVPVDKGSAVAALVIGLRTAVFAGDDDADRAAFRALRHAVASGDLSRAACVGVDSPEAPPALLAAADLVVAGPMALSAFLVRVADEIA